MFTSVCSRYLKKKKHEIAKSFIFHQERAVQNYFANEVAVNILFYGNDILLFAVYVIDIDGGVET